MHHSIGQVRLAARGKALGLRVQGRHHVVLAALISVMLAGLSGTKANVHDLFQIAGLPFVKCEALNAKMELTIAARGGLRFDEGDAERHGAGKRAAAEFSGKRSASGTSSSLSVSRVSLSDSPES